MRSQRKLSLPKGLITSSSSSSDSSIDFKKIGLGLGVATGVGLFLYGAYRAYKVYTQKQNLKLGETLTGDALLKHNLDQDIKKIGTVYLTEQQLIPFDNFVEIFKTIRNNAKIRIDKQSDFMKQERREVLFQTSPQDPQNVTANPAYNALVREQMTVEEKVYEEISNYLLEELGLTNEQFQQCQEVYMTSPQYQQRFFTSMNAGEDSSKRPDKQQVDPKFSDVQKVKEMMIFSEVVKFESAVKLENKMKGVGQMGMEVDLAVEAMIMQSFMADKFFLTFGVEEDNLFKAIKAFKLQDDPEVRSRIQENVKHLPPEVMQRLASQLVHGGGCHNECCSGEKASEECKNECCKPNESAATGI